MNKQQSNEATFYDKDLRELADYKRDADKKKESLQSIEEYIDGQMSLGNTNMNSTEQKESGRARPRFMKWMQISFFAFVIVATSLLLYISLDDLDWLDTYYQTKFTEDADIIGVIFSSDESSVYINVAYRPSIDSDSYEAEHYRILFNENTIYLNEAGLEIEKEKLRIGEQVKVWVRGSFAPSYTSAESWLGLDAEDIPTYTATALRLRGITTEELYQRLLSTEEGKYSLHFFVREEANNEEKLNELHAIDQRFRTLLDRFSYSFNDFAEYEVIALPEWVTIIITDAEQMRLITSELEEVEQFLEQVLYEAP